MQHFKILTLITLLTIAQFSYSQGKIAGLEIQSDYFVNKTSQFSDSVEPFIDNQNHFSLNLPKGWLITEDVLPGVHGVSTSDTSKLITFEVLVVTEIKNSESSLFEYFKKDIEYHAPISKYNISEIGKCKIAGIEAFWVYSSQGKTELGPHHSVLHYIKKENSDFIYLIQIDTHNSSEFLKKISSYRNILNSFKIK
tara:strand:+ start:582 stop:1169 length:588 start_codon:yes stop_codon:yes gene_type:complete